MSEALLKMGCKDLAGIEDPGKDIVSITTADCSDQVKLAALQAYSSVAEVKNVTIQNCTLTGDKIVHVDKSLFEE